MAAILEDREKLEISDLVNELCFSSKYQDKMIERKVRKSVLFSCIYEPSLLSLYDRMFINRRVFVPCVSLGLLFVHVCIFMNVLRAVRDA